jgi:hypothetical protein
MTLDESLIPISDDAKLTAEYINNVSPKKAFGWDVGLVGSGPVKGSYRARPKDPFSAYASTSDSEAAATFKYGGRDLDQSLEYLNTLDLNPTQKNYGLDLIKRLKELESELVKDSKSFISDKGSNISDLGKEYIQK